MKRRTQQWKTVEPIFDGDVIITADITGSDTYCVAGRLDPPEQREVEITVEYDFPPYEDITDGPRRLHGEEIKEWDHWLDELRDHACELEDDEDGAEKD